MGYCGLMGYGLQIPAHQLGGPKMAWDSGVMAYQKHGLRGFRLYSQKVLISTELLTIMHNYAAPGLAMVLEVFST